MSAHARSSHPLGSHPGRVVALGAVACLVIAGGAALLLSRPSEKPVKHVVAATTTTVRKPHVKPRPKRPKRGPVAPLTGEVASSKAAAKRCAVTVKIGNTAEGRPQFGLEQADVVFEEIVDSGITRLAAVFQSEAPTKVGSIRSVRPTDKTLVRPLHGIFAFSGGNAQEVASIQGAPVLQLDETRAGPLMFRDYSRSAPHNLYAHVDQMYKSCTDPAPQPLFRYRKPHVAPEGGPASTATINFEAPYGVRWQWKAKSGVWKRERFGAPDIGAAGGQLSAANVVVMSIPYDGGPTGIDNRGAVYGTGPLTVFTAGRVIYGTWSRYDEDRPARLLDRAGHVIQLTPGRTWVELPDLSYAVTAAR